MSLTWFSQFTELGITAHVAFLGMIGTQTNQTDERLLKMIIYFRFYMYSVLVVDYINFFSVRKSSSDFS